ncbi:hypothetical protein M501DRAFT_929566 [Patellaria atrata CBS 101060]|uniref:Uncharacterized protein n=1 Tax=Patellaria atrata CBS 101060 TaxID=1346257 RepID=A0A9P4SFT8_9PEZI|nr:hypothetical protein M501DRAFT_929566 [Patellaria atrata CBS 101060]
MPPTRTTYNGPALSGPGLIMSQSRLKPKSLLSTSAFNKWYNEVHIPDMVSTGICSHASRLECVDTDEQKPYLALYKIQDLSGIHGDKFRSIPMTHRTLPGGGNIHDMVEIDTRIYEWVQTFEKGPHDEAFSPTVMVASMAPQPGTEQDLDAWYRDEHNEQMSLEPGYIRTVRYKLIHQIRASDDTSPPAPSFLALHEFDVSNKLGKKVVPLEPMSGWTKRVLQSQERVEAGIFKNVKSWKGDARP